MGGKEEDLAALTDEHARTEEDEKEGRRKSKLIVRKQRSFDLVAGGDILSSSEGVDFTERQAMQPHLQVL